jgi:hypothetical protein
MDRRSWVAVGLALVLGFATFAVMDLASPPASAPSITVNSEGLGPYHAPLQRAPAQGTAGTFAFVSNFEDGNLDGWTSLAGSTPSVTTKTTYFGEPSLKSSASRGAQISVASQGFVTGSGFVSFQVALNSGKGAGYFGLAGASNAFVTVVGVSNGEVWAGSDLASLTDVGPVPTATVYPAGWVYLSANVYNAGSKTPDWVMDLYVDRSDMITATLTVPDAANYAEAVLETTSGTAYYTNIVVTTYEIPINIPGYNNMEGYGQGSGLLVQLLPAYTKLTAEMTLDSWDVPQEGILSFQINALNLYGTTRSTCGGFFQLGIDLNPNGMIAPWYVPGKNCIAHYFLNSRSPAIQPGVASPAGTHLTLTIEDDTSTGMVSMTIVDTTLNQVFTTSFAYGGGPFYGMYTQIEWQPCCSSFPIEDYQFNGVLYNEAITTAAGAVQGLTSSYMLPFTLDAPPQWSLTYYQDSTLGYNQLA